MKIKTTIKMITLSTLVLFTACVDQNSINIKKEKELSERGFKEFTKHKYVWAYTIKRDGAGHYFYVSADGKTYLDKGFSVYAR